MSDENDLVYQMRRAISTHSMITLLDQGADEIERLRAENERLRGLLLRVASEVRYSDPRVAESINAALAAGEKT